MLKRLTMPVFSPKHPRSYSVRSISFPARSHPNIRRIEEELNKLSSCSASANSEAICVRLSGLGEIYRCIEDLLNLPLTQQALSQDQEDKWVADKLDDLISYLDVCSNIRDALLVMKETARQLQSSLRRSKAGGELSFESDIAAYICSRKKMKKEAVKFLALLKQKDTIFAESNAEDHHLCAVIKAFREANLITIYIFSSLLVFLSAPILKPKTSKWAVISKLVRKEAAVACESQQDKMNEIEKVDAALKNLLVEKELELQKIESAQRSLEDLDISMEELENELECLFRHLIHTRVSLLNMVSHQLEWC